MKVKHVLILVMSLLSLTLFSQDKHVFTPKVAWMTLEEAREFNPDSVLHLNLSKTKLVNGELPEEIYRYTNLQSLNLRGLKLTALPEKISLFTHLSLLDIGKNKIDKIPVSLCKCTQLELFVAHKNLFDHLPFCFGKLTKLRYMDLWDTPILDLPESMEHIETLNYIDMQGVNLNIEHQTKLKERFPHVKFELDPPCNCFH
jgi:Leucine-rich repeat (LRR) protein